LGIPDQILTIPILAAFVITLGHFVALYRARVSIPPAQMVGAVIAAMSVQWTVARAVGGGVWKETMPFMRTAKGGATRKSTEFPAVWGAVPGTLLLVSAVVGIATNSQQIRRLDVFEEVLRV